MVKVIIEARHGYLTNQMKNVDQTVSETVAKALVHSIFTEHSVWPTPNNWLIVAAKSVPKEQVRSKFIPNVHRHG
jgi:hypothetical protein